MNNIFFLCDFADSYIHIPNKKWEQIPLGLRKRIRAIENKGGDLTDVYAQARRYVDFSNAARRAFTQIKKAELLGGMGKPFTKKVRDTQSIKDLIQYKKDIAERLKYETDKEFKERLKGLVNTSRIRVNKERNQISKDIRGYVDAAQIARRGETTPIKANTYLDRSSYITNPQDNTVLAATLNKIEKNTRKDGVEYGTTLYKNDGKLKASPLVKGRKYSVETMSSLPQTKEALIDIHSHPTGKKDDRLTRVSAVLPSPQDLKIIRSKTSLIVSPQPDSRTITKYVSTPFTIGEINKGEKYRQKVRKAGGDYTVITKGKNQ
ncbi:MAG: DUF4329 domain-containing protein [Cytophagales bacterium]|nr:DUF4329 domain-containing protein [Cytophagales bacterium]